MKTEKILYFISLPEYRYSSCSTVPVLWQTSSSAKYLVQWQTESRASKALRGVNEQRETRIRRYYANILLRLPSHVPLPTFRRRSDDGRAVVCRQSIVVTVLSASDNILYQRIHHQMQRKQRKERKILDFVVTLFCYIIIMQSSQISF